MVSQPTGQDEGIRTAPDGLEAADDAGRALTGPPAPPDQHSGGETPVREYVPRWEPAYLAAYSMGATMTTAADAAGVTLRAVEYHRKRSARFAALEREAYRRSVDAARQAVFRRGVVGWLEPVFFGGALIGHVHKQSDQCLLAYLKAHDAAYKDKVDLSHSGPENGPVRVKTEAEVKALVQPYLPALEAVAASLLERAELERRAMALPAPDDTRPRSA